VEHTIPPHCLFFNERGPAVFPPPLS
jgi:hypothetical protein